MPGPRCGCTRTIDRFDPIPQLCADRGALGSPHLHAFTPSWQPNHTPIDLPPGRVSGAPRKSSMKHKGVKPTVSASSLDDSHAKPGTSVKMASEDLDRGSNDRSVAKRSKRSGLSE